jgi:predicted nucleotidyltransferase
MPEYQDDQPDDDHQQEDGGEKFVRMQADHVRSLDIRKVSPYECMDLPYDMWDDGDMAKPVASEILPIWRNWSVVAIVHSLFYGTGRETASTIAARFGSTRASINAEVRHLEQAGLLVRERAGTSKVLTLVADHPALAALRVLVDLTVGPLVELRSIYDIEGVESVWIFGSWARRHMGERGPRPADVDVLVVGDSEYHEVYEACLVLGGRLGEVFNPIVVSPAEVAEPESNAILSRILDGPRVEVSKP